MTNDDPLQPGEVVLWSGAPDPRRLFIPWDLFLVPAGLALAGAVVIVPLQTRGLDLVLLIAIVAVAYLLIGRFFFKIRRKRRTRYMLTNRRALILWPRKTIPFDLTEPTAHMEIQRSARHCNLKFTTDDPRSYGRAAAELFANSGMDSGFTPGGEFRFAFHDIPRTGDIDSVVQRLIDSKAVSPGIA